MRPTRTAVLLVTALCLAGSLHVGCGGEGADPNVVRFGHFPNITHAHGLLAHHRTRSGAGWFERRLGASMRVEWYVFNAGPSAMEALRAGSLDATYVGPNPALNTYLKTNGAQVRVISGATRGGSALVVQGQGGVTKAEDLRGKRIATPQLGNTQDVACRAWLKEAGLNVTLSGGDDQDEGIANADQLALFKQGDLDAAWTVEPWVSRLESEARGRVLLEEPEAITTILVVSARLLAERPAVVRSLLEAHQELTRWIAEHRDEARDEVGVALKEEIRLTMPPAILARAWSRMRFDDALERSEFDALLTSAQSVGFLPDAIALDHLMGKP